MQQSLCTKKQEIVSSCLRMGKPYAAEAASLKGESS